MVQIVLNLNTRIKVTPGKIAIISSLAIDLLAHRPLHSLNKQDFLALKQLTEVLLKGILTGHTSANRRNLLIDTLPVARIKPVTFQLREGLSNHLASIPPKSFACFRDKELQE